MFVLRENVLSKMTEIELSEPDDFLKVRETLTRIGIPSKTENVLTQSCHILHKRGRYYVAHFKEMLLLDGKEVDFSEEDVARKNHVVTLLEKWGLVKVLSNHQRDSHEQTPVTVIMFDDKKNWTLKSKYTVGKKR